ncbi:penicillin-binding transpeptidase domain-containing protein [Allostreptomyces psammosilenae]|uniref:Penicillin-binding protein n=1 Tax=Allostreptomyces psammosilenae TaxID=1892865 RepID=A0A853A455_9ACTN|nr:penicillin-binding transpeptidase domain-containing protein [Allostreptomyces psammosilenae]NYI07664.1 hypothetical protein [Allostreptomyces psammosilenae]
MSESRRVRRRARTRTLAVAVLIAASPQLAGCGLFGDGEDPADQARGVADEFLRTWSAGVPASAAAVTDNPTAAEQALTTTMENLGLPASSMESGEPVENEDGSFTVPFTVRMSFPTGPDAGAEAEADASASPSDGAADASTDAAASPSADASGAADAGEVVTWEYTSELTVVETDGGEGERQIVWDPTVIHPELTDSTVLRLSEEEAEPADVLDRDGQTFDGAAPALVGYDGSGGLTARYADQLAGRSATAVELADRASEETQETLFEISEATPGTPVQTTIDAEVQGAAEAALEDVEVNAALVALDATNGEVLAVANNPASGFNRALEGRYPPGSDFKVITAAALLQAGVTPSTPVECPRTVTVNGQSFENQDEFVLEDGSTFRDNFANSCNTGIISLRDRLSEDALTNTAAQFGIGAVWEVGAATFDGSVPVPGSPNELAANMIGQGTVEASPLVMASVAATVRSGAFHQPVVVPDAVENPHEVEPLDPTLAGQLRELMGAVVTEGSGEALRGLPGEVGAKTGTAEFGTENPPRTHAWMIGYQDDVAFAVLLEDGGSGGRDAGPVARAFLDELATARN